MAKTINILPAVQVNASAVTVDVEITENGYTRTAQYAFNANDFDCNCSSSNPYVAKFIFDPGDITMILEVQGDFTTVKFNDVTKASAYALAQDVIADIGQYASAGGGGSYTFPTNHGNVAYVSVDGNDGTGAVGNISKPFENCNAAIAALTAGIPATLIVLSSAGAQTISDYDYSTHPYDLMVIDYSATGFNFSNSCSFGTLNLQTKGVVVVTTDFLFACDNAINIDCDTFLISASTQGSVSHFGIINCNNLSIPANTNNPSIVLGTVLWKLSCLIEEPIVSYTYINPRVYKGLITQSGGTGDPTTVVLQNSLDVSVTPTRDNNGTYVLTASGNIFTANKTMVTLGANDFATLATSRAFYGIRRIDNTKIELKAFDGDGFESDGLMSSMPITIEVYP